MRNICPVEHRKFVDIDREKLSTQETALAIEGLNQTETLIHAGYDSLSAWIGHQQADIAQGRRDKPIGYGESEESSETDSLSKRIAQLESEIETLKKSPV